MKTVGVLAFHGDVAEHLDVLTLLKAKHCEVRTAEELKNVSHLIIPGGESTVMAKFLWNEYLADEIIKRVKNESLAVYGTCAGAILLATSVIGEHPIKPLGLMDMTIERNAYGTQAQSFAASLKIKRLSSSVEVSFIRAPVISKTGKDVEVLATHQKQPVLVRQGRVLAGTFHPEIHGEKAIH
jgi:5'-phosphate synthase pdxT subunit